MTRSFHTRVVKAAAIVRLGRPKFLLGGIVLFGLGTLGAERLTGAFDPTSYALGQLAVTAIQLLTHYSNDYYDYEVDLANPNPTPWAGGSRVLVDGELERPVALKAALLCGAVAITTLISLLVLRPSTWLGVGLSFAMLALAWSYSSPPLRLHSRGLGEPTVWLVVPIATPLTGFALQAHSLSAFPILLVLPSSLFLLSMLLTFELPDEQGDQRGGKQSWTVLLGPGRIAALCAMLTTVGFAGRFLSCLLGVPNSISSSWLWLLPLGGFQLWRLLAGDWKRPIAWSRLEFGAAALFFIAILLDLMTLYRLPKVTS